MAERVGKEKISREDGYLYFLGKDGYAWRTPMKTNSRGRKSKVGSEKVSRQDGFLYFIDPPVTALRSPPDSRMTGADSPVMAASFTEATPSTTSPSMGIISPGSTSTQSPLRRSADDIEV